MKAGLSPYITRSTAFSKELNYFPFSLNTLSVLQSRNAVVQDYVLVLAADCVVAIHNIPVGHNRSMGMPHKVSVRQHKGVVLLHTMPVSQHDVIVMTHNVPVRQHNGIIMTGYYKINEISIPNNSNLNTNL